MLYLIPAAAVCLVFCVLGFAFWFFRNLARRRPVRKALALVVTATGLVAALCLIPFEQRALDALHVELFVQSGVTVRAIVESMLAMLFFCAPLEEAMKVGIVWPLYLRKRLTGGSLGVTYAVLAASGFAAGEILAYGLMTRASWLTLLRVFLSVPAHIFFAGVWGYVLGNKGRGRYFLLSLIGCVLIHAIYNHIVFSRGPALLVVAIPMFATMAWGVFALMKEGPDSASRWSSPYSLLDPSSVGTGHRAFETHGRTLKLQWIVMGAFVNLGVTLTFLAAAVYAGHRFHVDFALVEEANKDGVVPVLFLASGLLAAFPVSAFLVARASGTRSVLEPAWAMGTSILFVLAIFSVTEPTAIVIAMGLAPVGFLLACAGAVLGFPRAR